MSTTLRAEWLKLTATRAFYGMTLAAALLTAFISFGLIAQGAPPWHLTAEQSARLGGVNAITLGLFCLILGLRSFTEEFRYGTILHTAFSDPGRTRTTIAKALIAAAGGAIMSAISIVLTGVVLYAMTAFSGGSFAAGSSALTAALGLLGAGTLWAMLGVGVGAIIRQPVPAVVTALLWILVFENVAGVFLGPVTRYLPGQAATLLASGEGDAAGYAAATGIMATWVLALGILAWTTLRQRDVV